MCLYKKVYKNFAGVLGFGYFGVINVAHLGGLCYGPSVISVTVTKGGHPRGGGLYGTSETIRRGVSRVT